MPGIVALTGATGFVGSHFAQAAVDAGWRVRVLVRHMPVQAPLALLPVEIVPGSLGDPASLHDLVRGATAVVHVAGLVKARSRREFFQVNEGGVARLVDASLAQEVAPRFLLVSSLAAREPEVSAYAASKRAGEVALAKRGQDMPWSILRPPVVYGSRDRHTLAFFRAVAAGIGPLLAPEAARVSCLHVSDLSGALLALLGAGEPTYQQTYEIDDGQPGGYSWRRIIEVAAAQLEVRPSYVRVPRTLLSIAAHVNRTVSLAKGAASMLTPDKVREIYHLDWVCHDRGFADCVAWSPRLPLTAGVAEVAEWYKKGGRL